MIRPTVLILDDEKGVRETLRRFLDRWGYQAVEAATVDEALALILQARIDALILDVRLPGERTGLHVLDALREHPPLADVPVLVLTGGTLSETEEMFVASHKAHLFYKPEGFDTLLTFLDQLTGRDQPS